LRVLRQAHRQVPTAGFPAGYFVSGLQASRGALLGALHTGTGI